MVAINKVLAVAAVSSAVFASPIAQANGAVGVAVRDISPVANELYVRASDPFVDISTLLAQVGDFLGNALDEVLHLDLSNLGDSVSTLINNLLAFLKKILPDLTSFTPTADKSTNAYAIQNQFVGTSLENLVSSLGELVSNLLKSLTSADLVQNVAKDLRELVNTLDSLVNGLAKDLFGHDSLVESLGDIVSSITSALGN